VLFRINMYPAGREKRIEAENRLRRLARIAVLAAVNTALIVLFLVAAGLSKQALSAKQTRLAASEGAITEILKQHGGAMTREDLELVRMRAAQVRWSRILASVANATPHEVWLTRLKLAEGAAPGSQLRTTGLRITGKLKAGSEQAGLASLMGFLGTLRDDEYFSRFFHDPKLVDSTWLRDEAANILEFDVFCPAEGNLTLSPSAEGAAPGGPQPSEINNVGPGDAGGASGTGGGREGTL
jgi:Tfp pilus assembly protein PilN